MSGGRSLKRGIADSYVYRHNEARLRVPLSDLPVEGHCGNVVEEHEADRLHFRMTLQ